MPTSRRLVKSSTGSRKSTLRRDWLAHMIGLTNKLTGISWLHMCSAQLLNITSAQYTQVAHNQPIEDSRNRSESARFAHLRAGYVHSPSTCEGNSFKTRGRKKWSWADSKPGMEKIAQIPAGQKTSPGKAGTYTQQPRRERHESLGGLGD